MKDSRFLMGVITGAAIAFGLSVFVMVNEPRSVHADAPGSAGSITAITADYNVGQQVLYLIDSDQETIMTYMFHGPASAPKSRTDIKKLELMSVRSYKWDKKLEDLGGAGTAVDKVKTAVLRMEEAAEK